MNRNMNFYFCNLNHSDDEKNKANIILTDLRLSKHEIKYRFSLFLIESLLIKTKAVVLNSISKI